MNHESNMHGDCQPGDLLKYVKNKTRKLEIERIRPNISRAWKTWKK